MIYIMAILLGIISGILAKGNLYNLAVLKFQKIWFILSAAVFMIVLQIIEARFDFNIKTIIIVQVICFMLLFIGIWFNRRYIGILTIWLGALCNMLVIWLNGGKMPVSVEAVKRAGLSVDLILSDSKHKVMGTAGLKSLSFMADIIVPPGFLGFGMRIISIGDIIVALGLFVLMLQVVMRRNWGKLL